jgi:hypothetical protein
MSALSKQNLLATKQVKSIKRKAMGFFHETYPFQAEDFVEEIKDFVFCVYEPEGYEILKQKALNALKTNKHVKDLALNTGGWDFQTASQEVNEMKELELTYSTEPYRTNSIVFLLINLVYKHTVPADVMTSGLGAYHSKVESFLQQRGWSSEDAHLLVRGLSFDTFGKLYFGMDNAFWEKLHPHSMYGHLGWIPRNKFLELLRKLSEIPRDPFAPDERRERNEKIGQMETSIRNAQALIPIWSSLCLHHKRENIENLTAVNLTEPLVKTRFQIQQKFQISPLSSATLLL